MILYYYIRMNEISYQITAMVVRYILVIIVLMVFIRSIIIDKKKNNNDYFDELGMLIWDRRKKRYPLGEDNIIGSSQRCDIIIKTNSMARIHAQLYKKKDTWILCSYTSHPTKVNDIEIDSRVNVSNGDIITFGESQMRLELYSDSSQDEDMEFVKEIQESKDIEETEVT